MRPHIFTFWRRKLGPRNKIGNAPGMPGKNFNQPKREQGSEADRHQVRVAANRSRGTARATRFTGSTLKGSLRRCEPGNRNPERTATDVIQSESVAEFYARWFATVFAANSELDSRSRFATEVAGNFH
jgi:hypothetical protein